MVQFLKVFVDSQEMTMRKVTPANKHQPEVNGDIVV